MQRVVLLAFALLAFAATASAQTPVFRRAVTETSSATPDQLVARLMSFDRDGDRKVTKEELAERLENLLEAADASGDGVLDEAEIRLVAEQPPTQVVVRGFQAGRYGFADEGSQSSRLHIEGALEDLRLASPTKEEAGAIVKWFTYELEQAATADLLEDMASLLPALQFEQFRVMLSRQTVFQIPVPQFDKPVTVVVPELERQLDQFSLPPDERTHARLAVERFKNRMRTTDGDRSVLLERLKNELTDEERADLGAALARRPIAKAAPGIVGGAVQIVGPVSVR